MDTVLHMYNKYERAMFFVVGVCVSLLLTLILPGFTSDETTTFFISNEPPHKPIISDEATKIQEFESEIRTKYKGGTITDVDKGVKHIKFLRYYNNRPVRINIIEVSSNINPSVSIEPVTANSNTLASRTKISRMAEKEQYIAAINGGYFKPQTGVPLGTLMINKKIITGPIYDRVSLGIFSDGYDMARVQLRANIETNVGKVKIDNINQPRTLATHTIVYTSDWGEFSPPSPVYGCQIVVSNNKIVEVTKNVSAIPKDGFVIVGAEKNLEQIKNARRIKLDIKINPEWKDVNHIISGGPYLVKNNEIFVDMTAQKLSAIGGRNPRTAIGYTAKGSLIMLTADGRENTSIGLTLNELANLMKEFGCVNAMNLDGGSSSVMYVKGKIVNVPPVAGGIPLSHILGIKKNETIALGNSK